MIRSATSEPAARHDGMEWKGRVGCGGDRAARDGIAGALLRIAGDDSLGVRIKI